MKFEVERIFFFVVLLVVAVLSHQGTDHGSLVDGNVSQDELLDTANDVPQFGQHRNKLHNGFNIRKRTVALP